MKRYTSYNDDDITGSEHIVLGGSNRAIEDLLTDEPHNSSVTNGIQRRAEEEANFVTRGNELGNGNENWKGDLQTYVEKRTKGNCRIQYESEGSQLTGGFVSSVKIYNMIISADQHALHVTGNAFLVTKKSAEQLAARKALTMLLSNNEELANILLPVITKQAAAMRGPTAGDGDSAPGSGGGLSSSGSEEVTRNWKNELQELVAKQAGNLARVAYDTIPTAAGYFQSTVYITYSETGTPDGTIKSDAVQGAAARTKKAAEQLAAELLVHKIETEEISIEFLKKKKAASSSSSISSGFLSQSTASTGGFLLSLSQIHNGGAGGTSGVGGGASAFAGGGGGGAFAGGGGGGSSNASCASTGDSQVIEPWKTHLQEYIQEEYGTSEFSYSSVQHPQSGLFQCNVRVFVQKEGAEVAGEKECIMDTTGGRFKTKKAAEHDAAYHALVKIKKSALQRIDRALQKVQISAGDVLGGLMLQSSSSTASLTSCAAGGGGSSEIMAAGGGGGGGAGKSAPPSFLRSLRGEDTAPVAAAAAAAAVVSTVAAVDEDFLEDVSTSESAASGIGYGAFGGISGISGGNSGGIIGGGAASASGGNGCGGGIFGGYLGGGFLGGVGDGVGGGFLGGVGDEVGGGFLGGVGDGVGGGFLGGVGDGVGFLGGGVNGGGPGRAAPLPPPPLMPPPISTHFLRSSIGSPISSLSSESSSIITPVFTAPGHGPAPSTPILSLSSLRSSLAAAPNSLLNATVDSLNDFAAKNSGGGGGESSLMNIDWKGELQTFIARRYKLDVKAEYECPREEQSSASFKAYVQLVEVTTDRVLVRQAGMPSSKKKVAEKSAARILLSKLEAEEVELDVSGNRGCVGNSTSSGAGVGVTKADGSDANAGGGGCSDGWGGGASTDTHTLQQEEEGGGGKGLAAAAGGVESLEDSLSRLSLESIVSRAAGGGVRHAGDDGRKDPHVVNIIPLSDDNNSLRDPPLLVLPPPYPIDDCKEDSGEEEAAREDSKEEASDERSNHCSEEEDSEDYSEARNIVPSIAAECDHHLVDDDNDHGGGGIEEARHPLPVTSLAPSSSSSASPSASAGSIINRLLPAPPSTQTTAGAALGQSVSVPVSVRIIATSEEESPPQTAAAAAVVHHPVGPSINTALSRPAALPADQEDHGHQQEEGASSSFSSSFSHLEHRVSEEVNNGSLSLSTSLSKPSAAAAATAPADGAAAPADGDDHVVPDVPATAAEDPSGEQLGGPTTEVPAVNVDVDPSALKLCCKACQSEIGPMSDYFFYKRSDTEVQLCLRPDLAHTARYYDPGNRIPNSKFLYVPEMQEGSNNIARLCCAGISTNTDTNSSRSSACQNSIAILKRGTPVIDIGGSGVFFIVPGTSLCPGLSPDPSPGPGPGGEVSIGRFSKKLSWRDVMKQSEFGRVLVKTDLDFLPENTTNPPPSPPSMVSRGSANDTTQPLVVPTKETLSVWMDDWGDLLLPGVKDGVVNPRAEQLEAYRRSVLVNHIVVLPTGYGKTLIACMVIHRFVKMNPQRIAVFVVDRLPLVDQQSKVIEQRTGLRCAHLCSDTNTLFCRTQAFSGRFKVVVATAGALFEVLQNKAIRNATVESFCVIVFDECHHASGNHKYAYLLKKVSECPPLLQPRLLGLSASPCKAKTIVKAQLELDRMFDLFENAALYKPDVNIQPVELDWRSVEDSPAQQAMHLLLMKELQQWLNHLHVIDKIVAPGDVPEGWDQKQQEQQEEEINKTTTSAATTTSVASTATEEVLNKTEFLLYNPDSLAVLTGTANRLAIEKPRYKKEVARVFDLLVALEVNELMGPGHAREFLRTATGTAAGTGTASVSASAVAASKKRKKNVPEREEEEEGDYGDDENEDDEDDGEEDEEEDEEESVELSLSNQLIELTKDIFTRKDTIRGIIFVDTKVAARFLRRYMSKKFPELNPDMVTGQGGMSLAQQKKVLQSFRDGVCRLIVSTSVLEEGLDVQGCNAVFRIGGRASLIQLIQSRGRARQAGGKLTVYLNKQSQHRAEVLCDEMRNLHMALKVGMARTYVRIPQLNGDDDDAQETNAQTDSEKKGQLIEEVVAEFGGDDDTIFEERRESSGEDPVVSVGLKLFLVPSDTFVGVKDIERDVTNSLRAEFSGRESMLRINIRPRQASTDIDAPQLFTPDSCTVIVNIPTFTPLFIQDFCSCWNFKVNSASSVYLALNKETQKLRTVNDFQNSITIDGIQKVTCGYFEREGTYYPCSTLSSSGDPHSPISYTKLIVNPGKTCVLKDSSESEVRIEIPVGTMGPCVFLCANNSENTVTIYFVLKSTPDVLFREGGKGGSKGEKEGSKEGSKGGTKRVSVPVPEAATAMTAATGGEQGQSLPGIAAMHLSILAKRPILAVTFPLKQWDAIEKLLSDSSNLGTPALVTRFTDRSFSDPIEEALVDEEILQMCRFRPTATGAGTTSASGTDTAAAVSENQRVIVPGDIGNIIVEDGSYSVDPLVVDSVLVYLSLKSNTYCLPLTPRVIARVLSDLKLALKSHVRKNSGLTSNREATTTTRAIGPEGKPDVAVEDTDIVPSNQLELEAVSLSVMKAVMEHLRDTLRDASMLIDALELYETILKAYQSEEANPSTVPAIVAVAATASPFVKAVPTDVNSNDLVIAPLPADGDGDGSTDAAVANEDDTCANTTDRTSDPATASPVNFVQPSPLSPLQPQHDGSDEFYSAGRLLVTPSRVICQPSTLIKSNRLTRKFGKEYRFIYVKFRGEQKKNIYYGEIFKSRFRDIIIYGLDLGGLRATWVTCSASQMREATAIFVLGNGTVADQIRSWLIPGGRAEFRGSVVKYVSRMGLYCTADDPAIDVDEENGCIVERDLTTEDERQLLTDGAGRLSPSMLIMIIKALIARYPNRYAESLLTRHIVEATVYDISNGTTTSTTTKQKEDTETGSGKELSLLAILAIQIRFAGFKGVISIDWELFAQELLFYDSMRKFSSQHRTLCPVKLADYAPVKLNREILNILFSLSGEGITGGDWEPYAAVRKLQERELVRLSRSMCDPRAAAESLNTRSAMHQLPIKQLLKSGGVDFTTDYFFRNLLRVKYEQDTYFLRRKTQIPVSQGAFLMAIPDPCGVLEDGQVFVQICRPRGSASVGPDDNDDGGAYNGTSSHIDDGDGSDDNAYVSTIITGPVLLYRNPLLYPGDARFVDAVNIPALHGYYNVVIFPAKDKVSKVSLAASCSGGDLDGDCFSIIWDRSLVPPKNREIPPLDYSKVQKMAEERSSGTEAPGTMEDFVVGAMCNACLGKIANLHLAVCDNKGEEGGARNDLAVELAMEQSVAVDFPKTGIEPRIPSEAMKLVKERGYPDFMENRTKPSYLSRRPLGFLYRRCGEIIYEQSMRNENVLGDVPTVDQRFLTEGRREFKEEAKQIFAEYCDQVRRLMASYSDLTTDVELVMGMLACASMVVEMEEVVVDREDTERGLVAAWQGLRKYFRDLFFHSLQGDCDTVKYHKASAWYEVAYTLPATGRVSVKAKRMKNAADIYFTSFPWIVAEVLAEIPSKRAELLASSSITSSTFIGTAPGEQVEEQELEATSLLKHPSRYSQTLCSELGKEVSIHWRGMLPDMCDATASLRAVFKKLSDALLCNAATHVQNVAIYGSVALLLCNHHSDVDVYVQLDEAISSRSLPPSAVIVAEGDEEADPLTSYAASCTSATDTELDPPSLGLTVPPTDSTISSLTADQSMVVVARENIPSGATATAAATNATTAVTDVSADCNAVGCERDVSVGSQRSFSNLSDFDLDTDIDIDMLNSSTHSTSSTEKTPSTPSPQIQIDIPASASIAIDRHNLSAYIMPALDSVAKSIRLAGKDFPVIHVEVSGDDDTDVHADIGVKPDGILKAALIRRFYRSSPAHLPLFRCVFEWAQSSGIIRGGKDIFEMDNREKEEDSSSSASSGKRPPPAKMQLMEPGRLHAMILHIMNIVEGGTLLREISESPVTIEEALALDDGKSIISAADETCDERELGEKLLRFFEVGSQLSVGGDDDKMSFEWPVPGTPLHEWSKAEIQRFADISFRSLHCWVVSRSWNTMLQQASSACGTMKFLYRLTRGLSDGIKDSPAFFAQLLAAVSKATVKLDWDGAVLVIQGEGTPYQIKVLKEEVLKMLRFGRMRCFGYVQVNSSPYFMEGSTCLFGRDCDRATSTVSLAPYLSVKNYQKHHTQSERTFPYLRDEPWSGWRDDFKRNFIARVFSQLEKCPADAAEYLHLSIHFGRFYFLHATAVLGATASSVTISDLETSLTNHRRNRMVFDRSEYDSSSLPVGYGCNVDYGGAGGGGEEKREEDGKEKEGGEGGEDEEAAGNEEEEKEAGEEKSSSGKPPGSESESEEKNDKKKEKKSNKAKEKNNKGGRQLSASFYSAESLCDWRQQQKENDIMDLSYTKFFHKFGYTDFVPTDDMDPYMNRVGEEQYLVEVVCSPSYSARVLFNSDLTVKCASERPVSFVHGTLVAAENININTATEVGRGNSGCVGGGKVLQAPPPPAADSTSTKQGQSQIQGQDTEDAEFTFPVRRCHDVRLKLMVEKPLVQGSKMWQEVFPQGSPPIEFRNRTPGVVGDGNSAGALALASASASATVDDVASSTVAGAVVDALAAATAAASHAPAADDAGNQQGNCGISSSRVPKPSSNLPEEHRAFFVRHVQQRRVMALRKDLTDVLQQQSKSSKIDDDNDGNGNGEEVVATAVTATAATGATGADSQASVIGDIGDDDDESKESDAAVRGKEEEAPSKTTTTSRNYSHSCINSLAVLTRGVHYEGDGLHESQPVVDLSLEIFVEPLIQYVKGEASISATERWLECVVDHVLEVSDGIRDRK